jgi:hypothetical protein
MGMPTTPGDKAGWYPEPNNAAREWYWNGRDWSQARGKQQSLFDIPGGQPAPPSTIAAPRTTTRPTPHAGSRCLWAYSLVRSRQG